MAGLRTITDDIYTRDSDGTLIAPEDREIIFGLISGSDRGNLVPLTYYLYLDTEGEAHCDPPFRDLTEALRRLAAGESGPILAYNRVNQLGEGPLMARVVEGRLVIHDQEDEDGDRTEWTFPIQSCPSRSGSSAFLQPDMETHRPHSGGLLGDAENLEADYRGLVDLILGQ